MWRAVAVIERGPRTLCRQLDDAFENGDGDAMCAALYTLAERRPKLKANLPKYVAHPSNFPRSAALMGLTMAEIRQAAIRPRGGCLFG